MNRAIHQMNFSACNSTIYYTTYSYWKYNNSIIEGYDLMLQNESKSLSQWLLHPINVIKASFNFTIQTVPSFPVHKSSVMLFLAVTNNDHSII